MLPDRRILKTELLSGGVVTQVLRSIGRFVSRFGPGALVILASVSPALAQGGVVRYDLANDANVSVNIYDPDTRSFRTDRIRCSGGHTESGE